MHSRAFYAFFLLVVLPAGAYLVADIVNQILGYQLEASIRSTEPAMAARSGKLDTRRDYRAVMERNLFNVDVGGAPAAQQAPELAPAVVSAPANLPLALIGTAVGGPSDEPSAFAIIENRQAREQRLYRPGDQIDPETTLMEIGREYVVLAHRGSSLRLEIYPENSPADASRQPVTSSGASGPSPDGIQKVGIDRWILDRQEVEAALANLPQLLTKARVVPNFKGGQPNGFRVFSIVPGSFFSRIGLQNGDILQRINGIEVKDPENFMRIFQQLKDEVAVTVDLVRNNQNQTFRYEIR